MKQNNIGSAQGLRPPRRVRRPSSDSVRLGQECAAHAAAARRRLAHRRQIGRPVPGAADPLRPRSAPGREGLQRHGPPGHHAAVSFTLKSSTFDRYRQPKRKHHGRTESRFDLRSRQDSNISRVLGCVWPYFLYLRPSFPNNDTINDETGLQATLPCGHLPDVNHVHRDPAPSTW